MRQAVILTLTFTIMIVILMIHKRYKSKVNNPKLGRGVINWINFLIFITGICISIEMKISAFLFIFTLSGISTGLFYFMKSKFPDIFS
jgi:hypothetical protein